MDIKEQAISPKGFIECLAAGCSITKSQGKLLQIRIDKLIGSPQKDEDVSKTTDISSKENPNDLLDFLLNPNEAIDDLPF